MTCSCCFSRARCLRARANGGFLGGLGLLLDSLFFLALLALFLFLRSLLGLFLEVIDLLEGALAVNGLAVLLHEVGLAIERGLEVGLGRGGHEALRRKNLSALDDLGLAVLVQEAHERLAGAELQDHVLALEGGVLAERLGGGAHGLLLGRRVGA